MYSHKCATCFKVFDSQQPHAQRCSNDCRRKYALSNTNRNSHLPGISSGTVGAMSEMRIAVDLMEHGYAVFRALSPSCYCDLIATKDGKIYRTEARTGYISNTQKEWFPKSKRKDVDLHGVYYGNQDVVWYYLADGKTRWII